MRAPVAGEARLIAHIEALTKQTHPLNRPWGLQLPQPTVMCFTLVHLEDIEETYLLDNKDKCVFKAIIK